MAIRELLNTELPVVSGGLDGPEGVEAPEAAELPEAPEAAERPEAPEAAEPVELND